MLSTLTFRCPCSGDAPVKLVGMGKAAKTPEEAAADCRATNFTMCEEKNCLSLADFADAIGNIYGEWRWSAYCRTSLHLWLHAAPQRTASAWPGHSP